MPRSRRWSRGARTPARRRRSPGACPSRRRRARSARSPTWALAAGTPLEDIAIDRVFIGSCTNSRLEDLRAAARGGRGQARRGGVRAHGRARLDAGEGAAEAEGLDRVFTEAGFEWRNAGCSMCLGMNPDILAPGRALRLDLQPQLRGPPGPRRAHAPDVAGDGRGRRGRRPPHRREELELMQPFVRSPGRRRARPRQRRHRPDHARAVPEAHRAHRLRRVPLPRLAPQRARVRARPAGVPRTRRSSSPARTSARAPRASTRRGRSWSGASARSSRRRSATSSATTRPRTACSAWCCPRPTCASCIDRAPAEATVDLERQVVVLPSGREVVVRDRLRACASSCSTAGTTSR